MRKLLPFLKDYKKESIIGPLFKLLEASFELIVPLIMARIIDTGIAQRDLPFIWKMGGVLILLGVLGLSCSLLAQFFAAKAAVGFGTQLRHAMFAHIGSLSYAEQDKEGASTLIVRMTSDINQVQSGVNLVLRLFLRSPFIVVGALIMSVMIDWKVSLVFFVTVPLLALVIYGIMMISIPFYKKVQDRLDKVLGSTKENLTGVRVIRAFCTQDREKKEFEEKSIALMKVQQMVGRISALLNPLTYVIVNFGIIFVVWFGGFGVNEGRLTQGEVIALVNYMTQILLALVALANLIVTFTKALASAVRVNEVFALTSEDRKAGEDFKDQADKKVEMEHVTFSYQGSQVPALSDITFSVNKGETIGIIGSTGCGKSTLVNLIPRLYECTEGKVSVDGHDVKTWNSEALRQKIGIVPQHTALFRGTLEENLKMGREDATKEEMYEALKAAQALELIDNTEQFSRMISEGGKNLSGGQRQRVTIARALVRKPEILIFDDSSSALDFATDARLRKALRTYCENMTVFIVSQRAASIMHADRILVLDDGELAGQGTHKELLKTCEVYKEICYSQLSEEEVR